MQFNFKFQANCHHKSNVDVDVLEKYLKESFLMSLNVTNK